VWAAAQEEKKNDPIWKKYTDIRSRYRAGELSETGMWNALDHLSKDLSKTSKNRRANILQAQANILFRNRYPIVAAVYASQALRNSDDPFTDEFKRSWVILKSVSKRQPIQNLMEALSDSIPTHGDRSVPEFGREWNFFVGNKLAKEQRPQDALDAYAKINVSDRYFFPAKFNQAMIHIENNNTADAIVSLKAIVFPTSQSVSSLGEIERRKMTDYAYMALARLSYEQKKFSDAVKYYRSVSRTSSEFYDSLFEQSWALFMGGYPNHALGTLYAIRSPFYKETFNPEGTILASIVYYWMCRYDDSRSELADFMDKHSKGVESLSDFLERKRLNEETAYQLFEDVATGVSSDSLGIPRSILVMAAQQDSMMHVRDQYAAILEERQRITSRGIFNKRTNTAIPLSYLDRWANALKQDIGRRYLIELKAQKEAYDQLYSQAQFLYVELLMSQKDQLLGKELHGQSKIDRLSAKENIRGWGSKVQSWASDDKEEYWSDELGYHIYRVAPQCVAH
jgi:hypothetical protein